MSCSILAVRGKHASVLKGMVLLSALAGALAHADPSPALDRVSIAAGGFNAEPKIHVEGDTRYGHVETPDDELGHTTLPRIKAEVLLGDSQGLSLDYFRYDKDYDPTFAGQAVRNGQAVSGSAVVHGKLQLDLAQLAYKWWLGRGNDVFGIGVGAAYLHARVSGNGSATVNGLTGVAGVPANFSVSGGGSASESEFAPLLEFGWKHAFNPDLRLFADASGIKKNGGNVDGHIYGGAVGVEWFPARQVGLVLDYGIQKIKLNRNAQYGEELDVRLTGPSAFVKVRF
jgi:hypothetical protein